MSLQLCARAVEHYLVGPDNLPSPLEALRFLVEDVVDCREHSFALYQADQVLDRAAPGAITADPVLAALSDLVALVCEAPAASPDVAEVLTRSLEILGGRDS